MAEAIRLAVRGVVLAVIVALVGVSTVTAAPSTTATALTGTVVRVVDGDTIDVRLDGREERVRLIGVDTPETVHPEVGVEPWGPEASQFTKTHLPPGTRVHLELDVQQRDRYGRLLAYLYLPDGRMLNEVLLQEGLAQLLTVPPNVRYVERFVTAQQQARQARKGIWSEEPFRPGGSIRIEHVDLVAEEVVLVNEGPQPVDLSGWVLISVVGNQRFRFPSGTLLEPGKRLVVRTGPKATGGPGVLVWTRQYVWNNQGDPAELRDADGKLVSRYPD